MAKRMEIEWRTVEQPTTWAGWLHSRGLGTEQSQRRGRQRYGGRQWRTGRKRARRACDGGRGGRQRQKHQHRSGEQGCAGVRVRGYTRGRGARRRARQCHHHHPAGTAGATEAGKTDDQGCAQRQRNHPHCGRGGGQRQQQRRRRQPTRHTPRQSRQRREARRSVPPPHKQAEPKQGGRARGGWRREGGSGCQRAVEMTTAKASENGQARGTGPLEHDGD